MKEQKGRYLYLWITVAVVILCGAFLIFWAHVTNDMDPDNKANGISNNDTIIVSNESTIEAGPKLNECHGKISEKAIKKMIGEYRDQNGISVETRQKTKSLRVVYIEDKTRHNYAEKKMLDIFEKGFQPIYSISYEGNATDTQIDELKETTEGYMKNMNRSVIRKMLAASADGVIERALLDRAKIRVNKVVYDEDDCYKFVMSISAGPMTYYSVVWLDGHKIFIGEFDQDTIGCADKMLQDNGFWKFSKTKKISQK